MGRNVREYHNGSRWAFWRWKVIGGDYLRRLHLVHTPFGSICLHWFGREDRERHLHDHPCTFVSVILRGWYIEERPDGQHVRTKLNIIRATDRHRIIYVSKRLLTLCFMGPTIREWGFHTENGWVPWKEYDYGS